MMTLIIIDEFGAIYDGVKGKDAINLLISKKEGEVRAALSHPEIGNIDLIWGKTGDRGYGLSHIIEKHPEAVENLADSIQNAVLLKSDRRRAILVHAANKQKSIIDLEFKNKTKTWVVTSYIPI